ncbi:MAG: hypothetical protein H7Z37_06960, partial [Pyrinomonadaceae bacterium]|nr:hypothetical protein [Pyrinomonadaceae bacterium]
MNKLFFRHNQTANFILATCFSAFLTFNVFADNVVLQRFAEEPTIRIGLTTNASSVAISTNDSQLTSISPNESNRFLATNKINVT